MTQQIIGFSQMAKLKYLKIFIYFKIIAKKIIKTYISSIIKCAQIMQTNLWQLIVKSIYLSIHSCSRYKIEKITNKSVSNDEEGSDAKKGGWQGSDRM